MRAAMARIVASEQNERAWSGSPTRPASSPEYSTLDAYQVMASVYMNDAPLVWISIPTQSAVWPDGTVMVTLFHDPWRFHDTDLVTLVSWPPVEWIIGFTE